MRRLSLYATLAVLFIGCGGGAKTLNSWGILKHIQAGDDERESFESYQVVDPVRSDTVNVRSDGKFVFRDLRDEQIPKRVAVLRNGQALKGLRAFYARTDSTEPWKIPVAGSTKDSIGGPADTTRIPIDDKVKPS